MVRFLLIVVLFLVAALPVRAEIDTGFSMTLGEYNAVNPKQSKLFQRGSHIARGKVFDSQSRAVGEINDILIDKNGTVIAVQTAVGRFGKSTTELPLSYSGLAMFPVKGGYQVNQTNKQLAALLPELLSGVASASGSDDDTLSMRNLIGKTVRSQNGARIGKVEDVAFQYEGARAHSLLVRINYKTVAGRTVAVPLSAPSYTDHDIILSEAQVQTVMDFAK